MGLLVLTNYILIFLVSLCIGSFLNCVIYRIEHNKSFVKGRSHCPHCKHSLSWRDLIPVASFLFLKGRCRYCRAKISWQYPVVEICTAVVLLLIVVFQFPGIAEFSDLSFRSLVSLFVMWYVISAMMVIFVYDLRHYIIPDNILLPAIAVTFFYQLFFNFSFLLSNALFAALGVFVFFLAIFLSSRGTWMGFGDVKLVILLGLLLGFPNIIVALFIAFSFGAIVGVGAMIINKKGLKSEMPFAPFLLLGTWIALLWGPSIIMWYLEVFLFNA